MICKCLKRIRLLVKVEMTILCSHKRKTVKCVTYVVSPSKTCCHVSMVTCLRSSNSFTRFDVGGEGQGLFPGHTVKKSKTH
uniref:Uncharacterized protein n=1 Tax=Prolemur simus TaxID=1328070 RepID=A0A8C9AHG8_PROSS